MILGGMEILMLLAMGGGQTDALSYLDPVRYFESRKIPVTVEKMVELSGQDPTDGKKQVQQLFALRWLAKNADKVKADPKFAQIKAHVTDIAAGKKGRDLQGFSVDYAQRTLVAFGNKNAHSPATIPKDSVAKDALRWFPKDATLTGAFDLRYENPAMRKFAKTFLDQMLAFGGANGDPMEKIYDFVEKLGNARMDRISFAYTEDPQNNENSRIYLRYTGKVNHRWLVKLVRESGGNMTIKEKRVFRGPKITLFYAERNAPALGLVGDDDLIMAGYQRDRDNKHAQIIEDVLAIRSGAKESVLNGPLAKMLGKTAPQASAVFAGHIPDSLRNELLGRPFQSLPKMVYAQQTIGKDNKGRLTVEAPMANAEQAKRFVGEVNTLRQQAIAELKKPQNVPPFFPIGQDIFTKLADAMTSMKVNAKAAKVHISATLPAELNSPMTVLMPMTFLGARAVAQPVPPPPPPPPVKKEKGIEAKKEGKEKESRLRSLPDDSVIPTAEPLTLTRKVLICPDERSRKLSA